MEDKARALLLLRAGSPGWHTTEFWGKCALQVLLVVNSVHEVGIDISDTNAWVIVGGSEGLYLTWRSWLKSLALKKTKEQPTP